MAGIGVILNKRAGRKGLLGATPAQQLGALLRPGDRLWQTESPEQLPGVVAEFVEAGLGVLAIAGGDGSNHLVLSALLESCPEQRLPRVALLCGGTHNAHAASLGIRGRPPSLLQRLRRRLESGRYLPVVRRRLLRIDDGRRRHHGFSLASGFMYRFYRQLLQGGGDSPAQVLRHLTAWAGDLLFDGSRLDDIFAEQDLELRAEPRQPAENWTRGNGLACSAVEALGLGFRPFVGAGRYQDCFLAILSRIRPRQLLGLLPELLLRGRLPDHPRLWQSPCRKLELHQQGPFGYVCDGELYRCPGPLRVEAGPRLAFVKL